MPAVLVAVLFTLFLDWQPAPQDEAEKVLLANPLFVTLRDVDPEGFAIALKILRDAVNSKPAPGVVMAQTQAIFQTRALRYVLAGTDAAVVEYYKALVNRLEATARADAAQCHSLATGQAVSTPAIPMTQEVAESAVGTMAAMYALLESNRGRQAATFSAAEQASQTTVLGRILDLLLLSSRDKAIFDDGKTAAGDYARSCELNIELYKRVLALPPARSAGLLRFLASRRS